jgi:hypothetical protein
MTVAMTSHAQPWQGPRRGASPRPPFATHRSLRRASSGLARLRRWAAPPSLGYPAQQQRLLLEAVSRASHVTSDAALAEIVEATAREITGAERATCVLVDARRHRMWSEARPGRPAFEGPLVGVAGFVARTGIPLFAEHAGDDRRYRSVVDDPSGSPEDRLAAVPVVDDDGVVLAALLVVRSSDAPRFATAERKALAAFAARLAPVVGRHVGSEVGGRRRVLARWPHTDAQLAEMVRTFLPVIVLGLLLALFWR